MKSDDTSVYERFYTFFYERFKSFINYGSFQTFINYEKLKSFIKETNKCLINTIMNGLWEDVRMFRTLFLLESL